MIQQVERASKPDGFLRLRPIVIVHLAGEASLLVPHTNLGVTDGNKFIFND